MIKVTIHVVTENRLSSVAFILYFLVGVLIRFKSLLPVKALKVVQHLFFVFNIGYLGLVSLMNRLVAVVNVFLQLISSFGELATASVFNPLSSHIHCVDHVNFILFKFVNILGKIRLSIEILNPFVR